MKRLNFTLDDETVSQLEELSANYFSGNKSQTVRYALELLQESLKKEGWAIAGFTPEKESKDDLCGICNRHFDEGEIGFKPVYQKSSGLNTVKNLPESEQILCQKCADTN